MNVAVKFTLVTLSCFHYFYFGLSGGPRHLEYWKHKPRPQSQYVLKNYFHISVIFQLWNFMHELKMCRKTGAKKLKD